MNGSTIAMIIAFTWIGAGFVSNVGLSFVQEWSKAPRGFWWNLGTALLCFLGAPIAFLVILVLLLIPREELERISQPREQEPPTRKPIRRGHLYLVGTEPTAEVE